MNKLLKHLSTGNVIAVAVVIAALMISSAIIELTQSRKELHQLMDKEASSLMKTILESSKNNILANDEIDDLVTLRLLGTAKTIKRLDSTGSITDELLERIANDNSVYRINIFDRNGKKQFGSFLTDTINSLSKHSPLDFIEPILNGQKDEIIIGLKEARHEEGKRFAVAIRRAVNRNGAIVVNVDAEYMLQFKNKTGFEKMIQGLGERNGLKYIVFQNNNKIIASNKPEYLISTGDKDGFLAGAYNSDSLYSRVLTVNSEECFEVVHVLTINGKKQGLLRIAFNMDEMNSLESRMIRRVVILSFILIVLGVTVLSILNINRNLKLVSGQYKQIQTFSGNILQNMADAVITTDINGNIRIFNESAGKMFGKNKSEILGTNITELLKNRLRVITESLAARKELENSEVFFAETDGTERTVNLTTTFTHLPDGNFDSFTVVLKDLTKIRKMEETVKQQEKLSAMGELASGVAHEIRNPLNAISMIAQRLEREFKPEINTEEYLSMAKVMHSEVQRMNAIIEQFLKFAKPPELSLSEVSSEEILNDLKILMGPSCKSKGINFEVKKNIKADICADKELLKQTLLNLLLNAIDATPKDGKITLEFRFRQNESFCFIVSDTGYGMDEETLKKIFDIYYTKRRGGSGLGLSIARQIISQHGGTLKAESAPGKGSKFIIEIPFIKSKT